MNVKEKLRDLYGRNWTLANIAAAGGDYSPQGGHFQRHLMFVSKKYAVATKAIILAGMELAAEPSPDLISVLWPRRLWHLPHEKKK